MKFLQGLDTNKIVNTSPAFLHHQPKRTVMELEIKRHLY